MYTLGFSLIWTVLMTIGVAYICTRGDFPGDSTLIQLIMALMPLVGVFFIWHSLRKLRRFRSVRQDGDEFVWTELNGGEGSSATDPRITWDAEDRNFSDN
jgi:hypothetical protein